MHIKKTLSTSIFSGLFSLILFHSGSFFFFLNFDCEKRFEIPADMIEWSIQLCLLFLQSLNSLSGYTFNFIKHCVGHVCNSCSLVCYLFSFS